MPELPEVETIRRTLLSGGDGAPPLPGSHILSVSLRWPRHIVHPSVSTFRRRIRDRHVLGVERRGKYLVFPLDRATLLIHLMMSGDVSMAPLESPRGRFDHTAFKLDSGWELRFSDSRKFGRVLLLDEPDQVLGALGPEPLSKAFTAGKLASMLKARRRRLKPLLMDQTFLAGIGNIYADEALHRAGLHPLRRSHELSAEESAALWRGIRAALRAGLRHNGASIDWVYRGGAFQNHLRVYGRAGEGCPVCGTAIARMEVGQRGTHFCPSCQPEVPA